MNGGSKGIMVTKAFEGVLSSFVAAAVFSAAAALAGAGCTPPGDASDAGPGALVGSPGVSSSRGAPPAAVEPVDAGPAPSDPPGMIRLGYALGDARLSSADEDRPLDIACGAYRVQQASRAAPLRVLRPAEGGPAAPVFTASLAGPRGLPSLRALWCFDVTEDGAPELAYEEYSGGAHCCRTERVLSLASRVTTILTWEAGDGRLDDMQKLDGKPGWELVGTDFRLLEWDSPATALPLPIVFALRQGTYRAITREYPEVVRAHRNGVLGGDLGSPWGRALYRAGSGALLGDWPAMRNEARADLAAETPDPAAVERRLRELDSIERKLM